MSGKKNRLIRFLRFASTLLYSRPKQGAFMLVVATTTVSVGHPAVKSLGSFSCPPLFQKPRPMYQWSKIIFASLPAALT
jgi:hypothetical protein